MLVLVLVLVHHIVDRVCAVRQRRDLLGLVEQRPLYAHVVPIHRLLGSLWPGQELRQRQDTLV